MENKKLQEDIRHYLSCEFVILIRFAKKDKIGAFCYCRDEILSIADFLLRVKLIDEYTNLRICRLVGIVTKYC